MLAAVLHQIDTWFQTHVFEPLARIDPPDAALAHIVRTLDTDFRSGGRICLVGVLALADPARDRFAAPVRSDFARWVEALALTLRRAGHDERTAMDRAEDTIAGIQGSIVLARALMDPTAFGRTQAMLESRLRQPPNAYPRPR